MLVGQMFGVSFEQLDHDVQIARMTESLLTDKRQEFWAVFKAAFADGRRPSDKELDALIAMRWELDDLTGAEQISEDEMRELVQRLKRIEERRAARDEQGVDAEFAEIERWLASGV